MHDSRAVEPPSGLSFGFAPRSRRYASTSRRAANAARSSMPARSSGEFGLSRFRSLTSPEAAASSSAVVCHSGSSKCSASSTAGPRVRGFAPAQTSRLTHFRFPSWQNCRSAMSACSCNCGPSSGFIRRQSRYDPSVVFARSWQKARANGKSVRGSAPCSRKAVTMARLPVRRTSRNGTAAISAPCARASSMSAGRPCCSARSSASFLSCWLSSCRSNSSIRL